MLAGSDARAKSFQQLRRDPSLSYSCSRDTGSSSGRWRHDERTESRGWSRDWARDCRRPTVSGRRWDIGPVRVNGLSWAGRWRKQAPVDVAAAAASTSCDGTWLARSETKPEYTITYCLHNVLVSLFFICENAVEYKPVQLYSKLSFHLSVICIYAFLFIERTIG